MDTEALVPAGQEMNALGGLGFDSSAFELKPMRMELVQNTTRDENAKPGNFRVLASNEHFSQIDIVLLRVMTPRTFWEKGQDFGQSPTCRSYDGKEPSPFAQVPQAPRCVDPVTRQPLCPKAKWRNNQRPECGEQIRLIFVEKTTQIPYDMSLKGTSVTPIKGALQNIAAKVQAAKAQGQNPSIFNWALTIKAIKETNGKGTFYKAVPTHIKPLADDELKTFGELFNQFVLSRQAQQSVSDQEEAVNSDMTEQGGQQAPVEA